MSQLLQLHFIQKKHTLLSNIQTISLMLKHFPTHILWIKSKTMFLVLKSSQRFFIYQVTVIQSISIHLSLTVRNTWRSIICQNFYHEDKINKCIPPFSWKGEGFLRVGIDSEYFKDDDSDESLSCVLLSKQQPR